MRSLCTTAKSGPCSQLEKDHTEQQRPRATKKRINDFLKNTTDILAGTEWNLYISVGTITDLTRVKSSNPVTRLSIYVALFSFSAIFCSLQGTSLTLPLLNLFLVFSSFSWDYKFIIILFISFLDWSFQHVETQLISEWWFFILQLCWNHLLALTGLFSGSLGFSTYNIGLPRWLSGKEPTCQYRGLKRHRFSPRLGRSPGQGNGNPLAWEIP